MLEKLYKDFRVKSLNEDFTLQKLVNRSIHKFLTDDNFYLDIKQHRDLVSGSRFLMSKVFVMICDDKLIEEVKSLYVNVRDKWDGDIAYDSKKLRRILFQLNYLKRKI